MKPGLVAILERRPLIVAAGVFAFALALRLAFLAETWDWPIFTAFIPGLDDQMAWEAARLLRDPLVPGPRLELMALSAPLHVEITAFLQGLLGERVQAHRLLWAVVHALRFPLIFVIARRTGAGVVAAAAAALLLAAVPAVVLADATIGKAGLGLTLLTLLLFVLVRPAGPPPGRTATVVRGLLAGGLLSLAFLDLLLAAAYGLPVLLFLALEPGVPRATRVLASGCAGLVFVGVLAAFAARPASLSDPRARHLPRAGVDMKIGLATPDGAYHAPPGATANIIGHTFEARLLAEVRAGRPLAHAEFDRQERAEAWRSLADNPLRVARGVLVKLRSFLGHYEPPTEVAVGVVRRMSRSLGPFPIGFSLLLATGLAGVLALRRQQPQLVWLLGGVWLCVLLVALGGHVSWRYRLPAYVPLAILSARGLGRIGSALRERRAAPLLPLLAVAVLSALPPGARVVSAAESNAIRNLRGAEIAMRDAAALDRARNDPLERMKLLARLGRHTRCRAEAARLVAGTRADPAVNARHLKYQLWLGRYAEARQFLERVRAESPETFAAATEHHDLSGAERMALSRFVLQPLLGPSAVIR